MSGQFWIGLSRNGCSTVGTSACSMMLRYSDSAKIVSDGVGMVIYGGGMVVQGYCLVAQEDGVFL